MEAARAGLRSICYKAMQPRLKIAWLELNVRQKSLEIDCNLHLRTIQ